MEVCSEEHGEEGEAEEDKENTEETEDNRKFQWILLYQGDQAACIPGIAEHQVSTDHDQAGSALAAAAEKIHQTQMEIIRLKYPSSLAR